MYSHIKFCTITIIAATLISCGSNSGNNNYSDSKDDKIEKTESGKKVTKRATYINSTNSYSRFFLDSANLTDFISKEKINDTISRRLISFYNSRNYQYAWFSADGPTEQARGFWNMYKYSLTYDKEKVINEPEFEKIVDGFIFSDDTVYTGKENNILETELKLSQHFISYYLNNFDKGYIKRKELEKFVPSMKHSAVEIADSLISKTHKDDKYYEDVNPAYGSLKKYLEKYLAVQKQGGWPLVSATDKQLSTKQLSPTAIINLKRRLFLSGDLPKADSSTVWTDSLTNAVKQFQYRFGYTQTGILTQVQLKDMNVPVENKIQQLLINMGRAQWMVNQPKGRLITVNIPEFMLHVTENGADAFTMNIVVGKEGHNTRIFTGNMNHVVFAPYWNVPYDIVKKEIAPAISRNPNYLADNNMEVTGSLGNGLPAVRQLPGPGNALGKVKFLFPNSHDIYMHDTQAKSLFKNDKRAYSHGCIRLSDPEKMANYVLKDEAGWDANSISAAMNGTTEKSVRLKNPIPVIITYYTAWVDERGLLHYAGDVYGHDKHMAEKMFK